MKALEMGNEPATGIKGSKLAACDGQLAASSIVQGTFIATARGEVAVESLKIGDRVQTADSGLQKIRWIGDETVLALGTMAPIRIQAGTLSATRDLWLSAHHRVVISGACPQVLFGEDEVLIPVCALIDDHAVARMQGGLVRYFKILFDQHEIIFANGARCESYHPYAENLSQIPYETRAEILRLFPQLASNTGYGPAARCALLPEEALMMTQAL